MERPRLPGVPWYAAGGATLACLLLFGIPARRRWRTLLGMVMLLAVLIGGVVSCGGKAKTINTGSPGTTAGSYTITVTGTSGALSQTTTVNLTVN
jgi:hypothetical protein